MFQHHENTNAEIKRHGLTSGCVPGARRPADHAAHPSFSNTRETKSDSYTLHGVGIGLEVWTVDGTERGTITTDGKRQTLILTPVPLDSALPEVAHIDWLALSFTPAEDKCDSIAQLLAQLAPLLGLSCIPAVSKGRGWNGYTTRHDLTDGQDVSLGLIASGGERQRGTIHVELNAHACALVQNWHDFKAWVDENAARLTRSDLACDDFEGQTFTMQKMVDWYQQGEFNCGGRQPSHTLAGDWLAVGSPSGRTLYIGKRENGKMLRIYEKGKQLGDTASPWMRVELELRGKNRIIPSDVLINPGKYLAGSFRCLNFLSIVQEKIRTITKAATISYARAVEHARLSVGKLVNVMMMVAGGDAFQVISELKRDGYPERLKNYADFLPQAFSRGSA